MIITHNDQALAAHPTATKNKQNACLFIAFTNEGLQNFAGINNEE